MDDNKINFNESNENNNDYGNNKILGFDSTESLNKSNPGFNPTPLFARQSQDNQGYTVTPNGEFFNKPSETSQPVEPIKNENNIETEKSVIENSEQQKTAKPIENSDAPAQSSEQEKQTPDFIPNGTYSYSKSEGNIPSDDGKAEFNSPIGQPYVPQQVPVYRTKQIKPKKPKKARRGVGMGSVIVASVLAAVIGAGGGIFGMGYYEKNKTSSQQQTSSVAQGSTNITVNESVNSTVEAVAKKAGPSIIGIRTTAAVTSFFGGSSEQTEEGSGVIYTADGYIITNYHVIQSAVESTKSKVEVYLPSDTKTAIEATIVGYNINSDLAVVKVNKTGLSAIEFDDSEKLSVGQYVVAIGNPGGLEFMGSVSYGVISGLNRSVTTGTGTTMSLIQTDAAINPGNSGGALVNSSGKLIGINSIKLVDTSYEGMGFSIPSNTVKQICTKIIEKQNDPTPYIGIQISQNYTKQTLESLGYPAGAVVTSVVEGGPAADSGIQRGDIITEFNGKAVSGYSDLDEAISNCKVGDNVTVKIYRSGRFYSTNLSVKANNAQ